MSDVESFIRNQVRRILSEDSAAATSSDGKGSQAQAAPERQGPRVVRGRVGKGNFSKATRVANSLADKNPAQLVKNLGLRGPTGATQEEKVLSVVQQAISSASVMRSAYPGRAEIMQDEDGKKFIRVPHNTEIQIRDAAQYMYLVFLAAQKEGMLAGIKGTVSPGIVNTGSGEMVAILLG